MFKLSFVAIGAAVLFSGCASTSVPVSGMAVGKFVNFECVGGRFSARASENGETVRIRTLHGAAELERKAGGVYEGEGYRFEAAGAAGVQLIHNGKSAGSQCKVV